MGIVRKFLTPDEFSSPATRYDETGDVIQFTPDGGTTWVDAPEFDPRHAPAFRLPPLTGMDTQCRAAVGYTELVRKAVNERIDTVTAIEFAGGLIGIAAFIPGFNVLYALVLAFASLAVTIGREVLEAAFTEEVYDQIQCIFYSNMDVNGQMSAAQFADAYDALIDLDTIPRTWVQSIMNTFGEVGLSDAGVALEGAGDCEDCNPVWCYSIDFTITNGSADGVMISGGTWTDGVGIVGEDGGSNNKSDTWGYWAFPEELTVVQVGISYTLTGLSGENGRVGLWALNPVVNYRQDFVADEFGFAAPGILGLYIDDDLLMAGAGWDINSGESTDTATLLSIVVRYSRTTPLWTPNCDD